MNQEINLESEVNQPIVDFKSETHLSSKDIQERMRQVSPQNFCKKLTK